jgi:hypothetical protein
MRHMRSGEGQLNGRRRPSLLQHEVRKAHMLSLVYMHAAGLQHHQEEPESDAGVRVLVQATQHKALFQLFSRPKCEHRNANMQHLLYTCMEQAAASTCTSVTGRCQQARGAVSIHTLSAPACGSR